MMHANKGKGYRLIVGVSSVALIAALYAWVAAAASASDAGVVGTTAVVSTGAASSKTSNPIDSAVQHMLSQIAVDVQEQQNKAILKDMYQSTTLSPADTLMTQHLSRYCSSAVEIGDCASDPALIFGDIKVSSILRGSSYDDASKAAAQAFLATLLTPLDGSSVVSNFQSYGAMNADMLSKNPALKQRYVQALSDEALLSVVRQTFTDMIAKRTPPPPASQAGEAMPSKMALMEQDVLQRWMNSSWKTNLASLSTEQIQREIALMQASQLYMEYQRYQQMERVEALLAVSVLQSYRSQKNANALVGRASTLPDSSSSSSSSMDMSIDDGSLQ